MTIYYMDYENGDDGNGGTGWGDAWKTIAHALNAGDIIRIAKSPDPTSVGQTALWTNLGTTVVLQTGAVTAEIDHCESTNANWTKSTNVTGYDDTNVDVVGSNCLRFQIADAFTTGKVAYRDFGSGNEKDLSGYQQISFWFRATPAIDASDITIKLCSDATGDTPVDTLNLPSVPNWSSQPITINKGSALGSSIRSIAVYLNNNKAELNIYFDHIIACKGVSENDSLTLNSLISKNSAAQGGSELWHAIKSIIGTTITIHYQSTDRGYSGTTETVALYKREAISVDEPKQAATTTYFMTIQSDGAPGSEIQLLGGYNTSTSLQDGMSFFNGFTHGGILMSFFNKSDIILSRMGYVRFAYGFYNSSGMTRYHLNDLVMVCCWYGMQLTSCYAGHTRVDNLTIGDGCFSLYCTGTGVVIFTGTTIIEDNRYGVDIGSGNVFFDTLIIKNSEGGISGRYVEANTVISANHTNRALLLNHTTSHYIIRNFVDTGSFKLVEVPNYGKVCLGNYGGVSTDHRIYTVYGDILSETSVRHTASGIAWKFTPDSSYHSQLNPLKQKIAEVACNANKQVTVKGWFRRSNTSLTFKLVCPGGQLSGVSSDVEDSMTAAVDTWEELQIQFTPTEAGIVEIYAVAYGGEYNGYVDDMSFEQAA